MPLCIWQIGRAATEREQQDALRDVNDSDPLKWVGLQLCATLSEPHPSSAHHIWTPPKNYPSGAPWLTDHGGVT